MKLIVVDDYPLEGQTIEFLLHTKRPHITYCGQAFSGEEGLALALHCHPDLAIIDVSMPGMDGLELTQKLRSLLPDTKVIILSAYDDFAFVQSALRFGALDYMLKPISPEEFLHAVDAACTASRSEPLAKPPSPLPDTGVSDLDCTHAPHSELINRAKCFIEDNIQRELTLDIVAREIFISPYYLSRMFKKCVGTNFIHYVIHLRIDRAKHLLFSTNDTVDSIAQQVGYQESNSFRRLFKQQVGLSPREYRLKSRKRRTDSGSGQTL